MNNSFFTGRITRDALLKTVKVSGEDTQVLNASIAVNDRRDNSTMYVQFSLWRGQATALAPYLKKGKRVNLTGSIKPIKYTGSDGSEHLAIHMKYVNEIELLDDARGTTEAEPVVVEGLPFTPDEA